MRNRSQAVPRARRLDSALKRPLDPPLGVSTSDPVRDEQPLGRSSDLQAAYLLQLPGPHRTSA
jgi:hypothetical protein